MTKKDHVLIHVTDNGKGIPPEYLDKLFTNYFQVNDFNNQNTGYGIGLALSKIIVELHKGHLTVESNAATGKQEGFTRLPSPCSKALSISISLFSNKTILLHHLRKTCRSLLFRLLML